MYDGGGTPLKRKDLPCELQKRFPYSEKEAAEYLKQQKMEGARKAEELRARQDQAGRELKANALRQRRALKGRIEVLERELAKVHDQVDASKPRFRRRLSGAELADLERLTMQQKQLRGQIGELNEKVLAIDKQLALLG